MIKAFSICLGGVLFISVVGTQAQVLPQTFTVNAPIPDGEPTGLAYRQTLNIAPNATIHYFNVQLNISAPNSDGFNGDLYVTLQHDTGFSVLLNRPGAQTGLPEGDNNRWGMNVTFDHGAPDIHNYGAFFGGSMLLGTWSEDGRTADPSTVLENSPRTAMLTSFLGLPVNGDWTLFVSDLSSGGQMQLNSWSLLFEVPEPSAWASIVGALLLGLGLARKLRRSTLLSNSTLIAARQSVRSRKRMTSPR